MNDKKMFSNEQNGGRTLITIVPTNPVMTLLTRLLANQQRDDWYVGSL